VLWLFAIFAYMFWRLALAFTSVPGDGIGAVSVGIAELLTLAVLPPAALVVAWLVVKGSTAE
jgi:hypothetical protein